MKTLLKIILLYIPALIFWGLTFFSIAVVKGYIDDPRFNPSDYEHVGTEIIKKDDRITEVAYYEIK